MLSWDEMHAVTGAETSRLTALYAEGQTRILAALSKARERGSDTATLEAMRARIADTLADLRSGTHEWVSGAFPRVYEVGMQASGVSAVYTLSGAMTGLHTQALQVLADNAYNRLTDVIDVVGRRTDDELRAYALDAITGPMFGEGTARQAQSDIFTRIVSNMETTTAVRQDGSTYLGFQVAPGGRMWDVQSYAEMVARTTLADTMRTGSMMRMADAGIESYQVIGGPNPCEDCQAATDGGPYSADEMDALFADGGHFSGPNCECTVVADTAALDNA